MKIIIKTIVKILCMILYRPKFIGKEHLNECNGAIICPNHVHFWDSAIIVSNTKRQINALAKEELFKSRFMRWLADLFGVYPIKREHSDIQAIKISLQVLKNKELLLIFPEGTRNGIEKGKKPKNGAVTIAMKANVPIIPVGIQGSFKPFTKVKINIGKPIYYNEYKDQIKDKEVVSRLTQELMENIISLRDEKI